MTEETKARFLMKHMPNGPGGKVGWWCLFSKASPGTFEDSSMNIHNGACYMQVVKGWEPTEEGHHQRDEIQQATSLYETRWRAIYFHCQESSLI